MEGGKLKLVAKISDPRHRQDRTGPLYDGREVYVSNVDWSATQEEITRIFSNYGTIEKVRIPKNLAGRSKGIAFVVFSSKVIVLCFLPSSFSADPWLYRRKRPLLSL